MQDIPVLVECPRDAMQGMKEVFNEPNKTLSAK
jgi:hypothetical protein